MKNQTIRQRMLATTMMGGAAIIALAALPVVAVVAAPTAAIAQDYTNGTLTGSVTGTNGEPVVGAEVIVISNAQGVTRTTTTNANGEFRVALIPTGSYSVTVNAPGFDSVADDVSVVLGGSSAYDFVLGTSGDSSSNVDDIVVTGVRPQLDFAATTTGLTVDLEELADQLPIGRNITAVTLLAPTVVSGGSSGNAAFAGQPSIGGSSVGENAFYVNGLNTTNFDTYIGAVTVPFDFYKTVEVKTGGYPAEFGRATGGVVNAVTKSGTNEFTFGLHGNYTGGELEEVATDTYQDANRLDETQQADITVEAGGPIIRDRLFFYGLAQFRDNETIFASKTGASYNIDTSDDPFYGAKIDGYITDNHRVEFTYFDTFRTTERLTYPFNNITGANLAATPNLTTFEQGGENYVARYTGTITDWLTVSAAYGVNEDVNNTLPGDPSLSLVQDARVPPTVRLSTTQPSASNSIIEQRREFYRADADLYFDLFGQHHVRFGFDLEQLEQSKLTARNGGYNYIYRRAAANNAQGQAVGTDYVQVSVVTLGGQIDGENQAIYIQDSWDINDDLTVQLGVRSDSFQANNLVGEPIVDLENEIALRAGFTWDPTGENRDKVFGSYGRYFIPPALNLGFRSGDLFFNEYFRAPAGGFVINPTTGLPAALGTQITLANSPGYRTGPSACPAGGRGTVGVVGCEVFGNGTVEPSRSKSDLNLRPTSEDEFVLGYQRQFDDSWSGSLTVTHRRLNDTSEDIAVDSYINALCAREGRVGCDSIYFGDYQYIIANPGRDLTFLLRDPLPGGPGVAPSPNTRVITISAAESGYAEVRREYTALTAQFERAFDGVWGLQGSYTVSKSEGNYEGTVLSDIGQADAGSTILFDHIGLADNQTGLLPNHRAHQFKLFGSFQVFDGLLVGANLRVQSGKPYGCLGVHPTDPDAAAYGADSRFCKNFNADGTVINPTGPNGGSLAVPRGSRFNGGWSGQLDLSARYTVPVAIPGDLILRADVFNVTNESEGVEFNESGELANGSRDPNYLAVTGYQQPRFIRIGFDYQF
ncbi:MAG: TonB-dependent receptor [Pseudomonadota bacterium]